MGASRSASAAVAIGVGGLAMSALFIPFTIAHGPTSVNLEREVGGWDMHAWGFLLGTVPALLVGGGICVLRERLAGGRHAPYRALTVISIAMFLFAAMNLAFRAIGPPIDLFLLAPASVVAAATTTRRGSVRAVLVALAVAYVVGLALAVVPMEIYDRYDGYRIFGIVTYAAVGVLWTALGVVLLTERGAEQLSPG